MTTTTPPHPSADKRRKMLDATIKRHQYQQNALIEILHKAQEIFGYLENDLLVYIARSLKLPPSRVYGVATFYHLFPSHPREYIVVWCVQVRLVMSKAHQPFWQI